MNRAAAFILAALTSACAAPAPKYLAPFVDIHDEVHWQTMPMDPPLLFCIEYNQGVLCVSMLPDGTADRVFIGNEP